ncbi:uncharacterized protein LOC144715161 isoform X2 [Wolffia australiana]
MEQSKSSSGVRVLVRRPSSPKNASASSLVSIGHGETSSVESIASLPSEGVVVIGFVGPENEVTHLINRILDARVFGAGVEKDLFSNGDDELARWFRHRGIRYHHESDKGIVYLQFYSETLLESCVADGLLDNSGRDGRVDLCLEQRDSDDLRGLLLMFSICHVVVFLHEEARFDTNLIRKLRMMQSAKHALANFVRSKEISPSSSSRPHVQSKSSASPGRTGNRRGEIGGGRHGSTSRLMWGSGLHPSMLPGQCIPVLLFVFLHDLSDFLTEAEDSAASGSTKLEGAQKKKLQASLESQIRVLIKKCRILSSQSASSVPLFSLDPSRVAVLMDRSTTQRGESLEYITNMIELIINSKASADLLESSDLESTGEDVLSIKDFISKQIDALRGRGYLPSSGGTSSGTGVGMVAAAAAAAAASAASGKRATAPELPNLEKWLSLSRCLLQELLSAKNMKMMTDSGELFEEKPSASVSSIDGCISSLDGCKGLNMMFSAVWCQRALSAAKEVYLKDLPACYPTIMHKAHMQKALDSFHQRVRGPAVRLYAKRLEDECNCIWKSGRQLCDALSLTGKPCIHPMHHVMSDNAGKSRKHSSGFVSLHACACGRSRCFRDDPFDFDSANAGFNVFPCEGQLPQLRLPEGNKVGCLSPSSWTVVRLGSASYYDPSRGLVQRGFCPNENFLFKWTISGDKDLQFSSEMTDSSITTEKMTESETQSEQIRTAGNITSRSSSSFVRKGPLFLMKKPFSEVVSGFSGPQNQPKNLDDDLMRRDMGHKQPLTKTAQISAQQSSQRNFGSDVDSFLQIGSNVVPVNVYRVKNKMLNHSLKQIHIYFGFEHECPSGHRFMLSMKHLKEASSSFLQRVSASDLHLIEKKSNVPSEQVDTFKEARSSDGPDGGSGGAFQFLGKKLPMYIRCPHCTDSDDKKPQTLKFVSRVSQLQRIFFVTPPLPFVLSTCPVIQFEESCLPTSVPNREEQSQFRPECQIILPPESFISLRLPFIYGVSTFPKTDFSDLHQAFISELRGQLLHRVWPNKVASLSFGRSKRIDQWMQSQGCGSSVQNKGRRTEGGSPH